MSRPKPPCPAASGYVWVAEFAPDWRVLHEAKACRRLLGGVKTGLAGRRHGACGGLAVAEFDRGRTVRVGRRQGICTPAWWAYCPDHMYGKWVEGEHVMRWVLREREQ